MDVAIIYYRKYYNGCRLDLRTPEWCSAWWAVEYGNYYYFFFLCTVVMLHEQHIVINVLLCKCTCYIFYVLRLLFFFFLSYNLTNDKSIRPMLDRPDAGVEFSCVSFGPKKLYSHYLENSTVLFWSKFALITFIHRKKKKCLNTFGYFHFYQPMMELVSNFRVFFMFGQNRLINFNFKKKSTQNAVSFTIIVVILTLNAYRKQKKKVRHYAQFTLFFSLLSTT